MKRAVMIFILLFIPLSAFVTVYQVYRSEKLRSEIADLSEKQQSLFERNKRMIANIAILRSPERIDKLAEKDLGLKQIPEERVIHIDINNSREEGNQ